MRKKKRILGILLSLVMVLGLVPGMSLTALADGHTHSFTYSADGATITATCNSAGCNLTDNKVTLTIVPNPVLYYDDGQPKEASLEGLEAFNAATGKNISTDNIAYYKGDTNVTAQIKAGSGTSIKGATYTARLDVEGKRATVTFRLTAKPADHVHSFTYTASGNVITATCNQTSTSMAACGLTNKQATLTLNAPEHTTYGDGKAANATFTGEIPGVTNPTINYRKSDTPLSSAPTDAGTYTAWCQLGNATASVEYTIGKATNNGWTTLPQAIDNLAYTGQSQALITAGVPSAGNALYTVGTDPDNEPDDTAGGRPYTSSVPEMTNAGTYYVWCKIDGGKNYTSINAQKVEVTIARADITPSVSIVGWTYGQTANTPMVGDTDNPGNGEVTYTYKVKDADDSTYKSTVPTAAGNYTVKAVIAETANYNSGVATKDFTISKAALTVTAKDQNVSVGDEVPDLSDPVLDTHYTVAGLVGTDTLTTAPTLAYQKNGNAATPDSATAGTYDIVPSGAVASDNYSISYTNGTLTITAKDTQTITASDVTATYGDTDKSVSASTDGNGEISYAVKAGSENYIDVNASTGALTIKAVPADGKAYVTVTAAETTTGGTGGNGYAAATKDVTVNISKATVTITAKDQSIYVGSTVPTLSGADFYTVTGLVGEETLTTNPTLAYQKNGEAATPDNTVAGTYDIVPSGASAGDNYNISYENGTLTIRAKADAVVTRAPSAKFLIYNGRAQELVTPGKANGGTMQYALGTDAKTAPEASAYTESIPTGTKALTYHVWYKVVGDANHNDTAPSHVAVAIIYPAYEPEEILLGDTNDDGVVDGRDVVRLLKYLAGQGVSINLKAADVNRDGLVDGRDLLRLAMQTL